MSKINQEEYEILKEALNEGYEWIARDEDSILEKYKERPYKFIMGDVWKNEYNFYGETHEYLGKDLFQFIQWEDEEPYNIQELIEEYEYWQRLAKEPTVANLVGLNSESEETEVKKDKKWFVDKWTKERNKTDVHDPMYHFINEFIADVNQLDEPEVLTQEWIDEHKFNIDTYDEVINVDDLQNLLVPKQEVPVIPNYVAKWISKHHERFDLYPALKRLENNALSWEDVYEWYRRNTYIFVNAYLTGKYEVEEEQKYYVMNNENELLLSKNNDDEVITYSQYYPQVRKVLSDLSHYQLTEQEIKDYDERYFAFAVKVEELEE